MLIGLAFVELVFWDSCLCIFKQKGKPTSDEYIKEAKADSSFHKILDLTSFQIMLLMGCVISPKAHIRNLSYVGDIW